MTIDANWEEELKYVTDMMRDISVLTDPQAAAQLYGERLRASLMPGELWMSVSRRGLEAPAYRITRSSTWTVAINPWKEREKLPLFRSGILGELIYSNEPAIITNLQERLSPDDPGMEYFKDMNLLIALPNFDQGQALNMSVILMRNPAEFPMEKVPNLLWQSNLWGRSTINLVLKTELKEAYDQVEHEIQVVGRIQQALLPQALPEIPGVELAAYYQTSRTAGGDYYDFFELSDGRWGIFIADVSGHGPSAAVMMAVTHAIAHSRAWPSMCPEEMMKFLNTKLVQSYTGRFGMFVTAMFAIYDPKDRSLTYSSAGHNGPPWRHDGKISTMDQAADLPLGVYTEVQYTSRREVLSPGDALVFYTDGITEAMNPEKKMFGIPRLNKIVEEHRGTAAALMDTILKSVEAFSNGRMIDDDRTIVVLSVV